MYISKVTLRQGPEFFKFINRKTGLESYALHQLLWSIFPNDGSKKRDFLFHKDEKSRVPSFFVVSQEKPVETEVLNVQTKDYKPSLAQGDKLAFKLAANPVVSRKTEGKKHSVKHDIWMDAKKAAKDMGLEAADIYSACEKAVKDWLIRQGKRSGFHCSEVDILVDGYQQHRFYKGKEKSPIKFSSIHYAGALTVTDPEAFIGMLGKGIGKSKAFGCGLMLVKRI
jgi:CRISPR system Cascade subunit CasE